MGFYRGCHARGLDDIPFMRKSNSVNISLDQMKTFAETKGKTLLIIIDQMNRKLDCFDALKKMSTRLCVAVRWARTPCASIILDKWDSNANIWRGLPKLTPFGSPFVFD
jgi:hypothetical protein